MTPEPKNTDLVDLNIPVADISELISEYDVTRLRLHQCAMFELSDNEGRNTEMSDNEYLYMSKQEDILDAAAAVPIKSEADVKNLLRLWQKEQTRNTEDMSAADHLVMAICAHYKLTS